VGTTALVGGIQKAKDKTVDFNKVLLFGIPSVIAVFFTRRVVVPNIPDIVYSNGSFTLHKSVLIMSVFAIVMIIASVRMIQPFKVESTTERNSSFFRIIVNGLFIGCVAGFVGAGGGFLIIPALVFLARTPMKIAVGTSLFIVATQSLIGFLGDLHPDQQAIDWKFLLLFSLFSIIGIFIGGALSKIISGEKLKKGFGYAVMAMGVYIILKELVLR